MEDLPPRYSPDNSPDARRRRMAQNGGVLLRIIETDQYRYILGALNTVVGVELRGEATPPPPPELHKKL